MPHLMNCPHKAGSWCLDCVKKLGEENISLQNQRDSLAKGIRDAAVAVGIIKPETGLDRIQLLVICQDLATQAKKVTA